MHSQLDTPALPSPCLALTQGTAGECCSPVLCSSEPTCLVSGCCLPSRPGNCRDSLGVLVLGGYPLFWFYLHFGQICEASAGCLCTWCWRLHPGNAQNPTEIIWACLDDLPTAVHVFSLSSLQFCCNHLGGGLVVNQ